MALLPTLALLISLPIIAWLVPRYVKRDQIRIINRLRKQNAAWRRRHPELYDKPPRK